MLLIPTHCSRRDKRVLWSTVSKAALRSTKIKMAFSQESRVRSRSFVTFNKAVSVL